MRWDAVKKGLFDELQKISSVSIKSLSPETVLSAEEPPPMETVGFQKARDILTRAQMAKTAGLRHGTPPDQLPKLTSLTSREKKDDSAVGKATSFGGHTLAGAGAGRFMGEFAHGAKAPMNQAAKQALHSKKYWGTVAGAGLGAVGYGYRKLRARQMEKRSGLPGGSPAGALRAGQMVGHKAKGLATSLTPTLGAQVPGRIGQAGRVL